MTEDELSVLVEQAHQLRELQRHPGWAVMEDWVLRGPVGTKHKHSKLVSGDVKSLEEYASLTGFLHGVDGLWISGKRQSF